MALEISGCRQRWKLWLPRGFFDSVCLGDRENFAELPLTREQWYRLFTAAGHVLP